MGPYFGRNINARGASFLYKYPKFGHKSAATAARALSSWHNEKGLFMSQYKITHEIYRERDARSLSLILIALRRRRRRRVRCVYMRFSVLIFWLGTWATS